VRLFFALCVKRRIPHDIIFTIYVRPLLEYGIVVWAPVSVDGIDRLEAVQRSFLKKIVGYGDLSYPDRLKSSGLVSLRCRRATSDLLFIYKILTGSVNVSSSHASSSECSKGTSR